MGHLLHIQSARGYIIDSGDNITALDARQRAGIIGQGGNDDVIVAPLAKDDANATEGAIGHFAELLVVLTIQVNRIGVSHGLHHTLNGAVKQLMCFHLAIIIVL